MLQTNGAFQTNVGETTNMKKFTQITFNPSGEGDDVFFLDGKLLFQGDYYHDKITDRFDGVKAYLSFMKEEYSHERWNAETKDQSSYFWEYDYQADGSVTLENYFKRIGKDFNLEKR